MTERELSHLRLFLDLMAELPVVNCPSCKGIGCSPESLISIGPRKACSTCGGRKKMLNLRPAQAANHAVPLVKALLAEHAELSERVKELVAETLTPVENTPCPCKPSEEVTELPSLPCPEPQSR